MFFYLFRGNVGTRDEKKRAVWKGEGEILTRIYLRPSLKPESFALEGVGESLGGGCLHGQSVTQKEVFRKNFLLKNEFLFSAISLTFFLTELNYYDSSMCVSR